MIFAIEVYLIICAICGCVVEIAEPGFFYDMAIRRHIERDDFDTHD